MKELKLDDLVCLYSLCSSELCRLDFPIPDTLIKYKNQLDRIAAFLHKEIIEKSNDRQE